MKILHLFSNVKFTGPAEPAINLCASLKDFGCEIIFACSGSSAKGTRGVEKVAAERGLKPITRFRLNKHFNIRDNVHDIRKLPAFIRKENVDIVHTHLDNDHLVGGRCADTVDERILLIRSCYSGDGMKPTLRNKYSMRQLTDGLITASESARVGTLKQFSFPDNRIWTIHASVDTSRFDESQVTENLRPKFELDEDDFVFGVVARIQPYRRFEVILKAMKKVSRNNPRIKLLVVGRGTRIREVAIDPVKKMRLERCVKFAGYQTGPDYVNTLACFNAMIFLMPGTDGTCRAVRETMAMGKPIIAARRGMLPEIVDHGVNGLVIDDEPEMLGEAIHHLVEHTNITGSMAEQALRKTRRKFRLDSQAKRVAAIYQKLLRMGPIHGAKTKMKI